MPSVAAQSAEVAPRFGAPILDLNAFDATPLQREPVDHLVVPDFVRPEALTAVNADYPEIDRPANFRPEDVRYGPAFQALLDELTSDEVRARFATKFGVDLGGCETTVTVRRFSEATDGNIHTDHRSKIITVLVYFNPEWPHEGGRLRFLRSATDMEDYAVEVPPQGGTMLAFRRTDTSFHGHKPFVGERRMVQMHYGRPSAVTDAQRRISRITKPIRRLLNMS